VIIVGAIGIWTLVSMLPQLSCTWHACPSNGLSTSNDTLIDYDGVVTDVIPRSPAAAASIVPGDRVALPLPYGLFRNPPKTLTLPLIHDGTTRLVTLSPIAVPLSNSGKLRQLALSLSYLIFVIVGSGLLLLRPSTITWVFYLYCVLRRFGDLYFYWPGSDAIFWSSYLMYGALGGANCALVMIFALRFPSDRLEGWRTTANRAAVLLAAILPLLWLYLLLRQNFLGLPSEALVGILVLVTSTVYLGAAAAFVLTLARSHGDERQRLRWILVFPIFLVLRVVAINLPASLPSWSWDVLIALAVAIPLTVAYAVVRRRVFDIQFVISRALVYAGITSIVAGAFLLLDWFMSKQFAQTRFTLTAEIILALAVGSWLNMLHRNVDRFVDSTFFRQRHLAESRLAKAASAVLHAESHEVVDRFLVHEPVRALELTSAAIFHRDQGAGHFTREVAVCWDHIKTKELTANDPLVLHLLAEEAPVRLADVIWPSDASPTSVGDSVLAMPVLLRDQLVAIVLYGPHRSGADIDPDEVRGVLLLVERAGAAYDHIEARALREQVTSLIRERDAKQREIEMLRAGTA
jgi:hypothetical protein